MKVFCCVAVLFFCSSVRGDMKVIGHRGAAGCAPENTLAAFQKALDMGVSMVELDVQCCKSGELVVFHDSNLERVTGKNGFLAQKTLAELQQLRVKQSQETIPTLEQVLDFLDRRVVVNIELKGPGTALPTAAIITRYVQQKGWSYTNFCVSSFDHFQLRAFKKLVPEVETGAIIAGLLLDRALFAQEAQASIAVFDADLLDKSCVDDAHARGLKVFAYTVNYPEQALFLEKMGVDGIFSDYPGCIKKVF